MSKLPQVSGKETIRALNKIGFDVVKQKGSHVKLVRIINNQRQVVTVPMYKLLKKGILRDGILKPINLRIEDFIKLIKD